MPLAELSFLPDPDADPSTLAYTFGGIAPVASVRPGTVLTSWTHDCFAGQIRQPHQLVSTSCDPRYLNPQTGPFYVEGAEPGDTLAVHFVSIEPRHAWGISANIPMFGSLAATPVTPTLNQALAERTWFYQLDLTERLVCYRAVDSVYEVDLPLDPMHGTVGVAPALGEVRSSLAPGNWGGNMDTPEMRAGVTCYLGVNVEGALFSFGDGHARQGEGETCGVAVETAMDTVLIIDLIKDRSTPWPRIESDDYLITTGSTKPLEDAFRIAHSQLVAWLVEETGISPLDAYQLVTQGALSPVANVVDVVYTMTAKFPKRYLPGAIPMGGMHALMRERSRELTSSVASLRTYR
jgi:acetamidase/formamidase